MEDREKYRKGHRKRLRDKFLQQGIDSLSDVEVVELLLTMGQPRGDVKIQSRQLIRKFKNLYGVLTASGDQLRTIEGIGPNNIFGISFVSACYKKAMSQSLRKSKISNYIEAKQLVEKTFNVILGSLKDEQIYLILLNNGNKVEQVKLLSDGTVGRAELYPRKVLEQAINHKAASIILIHNHPSGIEEPSDQDIIITKRLKESLENIDVYILDHIIVARNKIFSFRENQLI
ncbi:MAG: RadC family protein [bacterium]